MKRFLVMLLSLVLVFSMSTPAFAAGAGSGDSYTYTVAANGSQNASVEKGDTVTITLALSKDGADRFDLYSMQDYVRFDPNYFDFVEGSISVYTAAAAGSSLPAEVLKATALADKDTGITDRVFVNRAVTGDGVQIDTKSGEIMLTFQLKAKKTGTTSIYNQEAMVLKSTQEVYSVSNTGATVTITTGSGSGGESGGESGGDSGDDSGGDSGGGSGNGSGDGSGSGNGSGSGSGTGSGSIYNQNLTIKTDGDGIVTTLNSIGTRLTIAVEEGYELVNVTLNGVSKGAVTSLSGLKTGDVVVITSKKIESESSAGGTLTEIDIENLLAKLTPVARSSRNAKKNTKVVVKLDETDQAIIKKIESAGYTVKYNFYRSKEKSSKYKSMYISKAKTYTNTFGEKGTMYYYKVRVQVYNSTGKLVARTQLKQCKYANRRWVR